MKTPLLVFSGFVLLTAGAALGWAWRGHTEVLRDRKNLLLREESNRPGATLPKLAGSGTSGSPDQKGSGPGSVAASGFSEKVESPADAAQRLLKSMIEDGSFRNGPPIELFDFLQALAGCDLGTLEQLLAQMHKSNQATGRGGGGREPIAMMILARMASINPDAAIDGLLEIKKDGGRLDREFMSFIAAAAARTDPSKMQSLIDRLPDDESKRSAQAAWVVARARQDPDAALQELAGAPPQDDAGYQQAREVIRTAAGKAPEKALETLGKWSNPDQQARMVGEVMQRWLERDAKAAAKWATDNGDAAALAACLQTDATLVDADKLRQNFSSMTAATRDVRTQLAGSLAGNLAQKDVNSALTWASTLSGEDQVAAQGGIGRSWIDKDPVAASEWLATWPQSPAKDGVATYLVNKISADDPESAFVWACSIQGEQRSYTIGRALSAMKAKDPAAAEQAINGLPEGERVSVRRAMERRGR